MSVQYNSAFPVFSTPSEIGAHLTAITSGNVTIRNFIGKVEKMDPSVLVVETELFPRDALEFYTTFNLNLLDLENEDHKKLHAKFYNAARGGGQGDYRENISAKIDNVVDCLTKFPHSKRAILTIPNRSIDHTVDENAKCLRELHFYIDYDESNTIPIALSCTGMMRAQAATIFSKNIHFIGTLQNLIASKLNIPVGSYTHIVTTLVDGREH